MMQVFRRWRREFFFRQRYSVSARGPFFKLAGEYLPKDQKAAILDIGAGDGSFARQLRLSEKYENLFLLDQNDESIENLAKLFPKTIKYQAPDALPFDDESISFIHLSHIVEHLAFRDLYLFLKECDRVLTLDGILVISTPLLWTRFYDDLSHVKPYNPEVFLHYLTRKKANASAATISDVYTVCTLVYRYRIASEGEWGSKYFFADTLIRCWRILISFLGFRRYIKNGYTLVLRKTAKP